MGQDRIELNFNIYTKMDRMLFFWYSEKMSRYGLNSGSWEHSALSPPDGAASDENVKYVLDYNFL